MWLSSSAGDDTCSWSSWSAAALTSAVWVVGCCSTICVESVRSRGTARGAVRSAAREMRAPRDTSDVVRSCMRARRMWRRAPLVMARSGG